MKTGGKTLQNQPHLFESLPINTTPVKIIFWLLRSEQAVNFARKIQTEGTSPLKLLLQYSSIAVQQNPSY